MIDKKSGFRLKRIGTRRSLTGWLMHMASVMKTCDSLQNTCFISILKGGAFITPLLIKQFSDEQIRGSVFGFLGLSSYADKVNSSRAVVDVTYLLDLKPELVKGRKVWIIDDIIESGATVIKAIDIIRSQCNPVFIRVAILVNKMNCPKLSIHPKVDIVAGFEYVGDKFLVGMGMGWGEKFRELSGLYELI